MFHLHICFFYLMETFNVFIKNKNKEKPPYQCDLGGFVDLSFFHAVFEFI